METETKKATKNTSMLLLMNIAKMIFPLITLPYLTRVLSLETYAVVGYVKAVMQYVQIILMFGFQLSATKDIVRANGDREELGRITGGVYEAKGLLSALTAIILIPLVVFIPLLRENPLYTFLAFINIVITEMLADFLFRGLDRMEGITFRFVAAKIISIVLTFLFIKDDTQIFLIPIFDILGSTAALFMAVFDIRKLGIKVQKAGLTTALNMLKESAVYFFSSMATTAFGALNTVLVGIFVTKADVSYWSNCMQLVSAVQSLYTPITNGIYPSMIRTKSLKFLKKILFIFMPIVTAGCFFCYFAASWIITFVFGVQYIPAIPVFQSLIPVLFFSFPAMLFGWPALGAIDRQKETSITTIITAVIQILGLIVLILINQFTLINIALLRGITEFIMLAMRFGYCMKFRYEFSK